MNAYLATALFVSTFMTPTADPLSGEWKVHNDISGNVSDMTCTLTQKGEELTGTYSVDGPVLILERKEGGALAGTARFTGDNKLNFKLVGGPTEDKGLDFGRQ